MLQRRIGLLFASLAGLSFAFNASADMSPQASFNALEMLIIGPIFLLTALRESRVLQGVQLVTLTVCAMISFRLSENPFFGFAMITIMGALLYAYGGYQTFQGIKVALSLAGVYALSFLSIIGFIPVSIEAGFKAFNWTAAIFVASLVFWWIIKHVELTFHKKIEKEIAASKAELEDIKIELGRYRDGHASADS